MYNKLLERQLKRYLKTTDPDSNPELVQLLNAISEAYTHSDEDRILLERSLEISSAELTETNKILQDVYKTIDAKNQDLIASLEYARLVQSSLLASEGALRNIFPNGFVFNQPKDIVSGDFFWVYQKGIRTFLAAVDCTGHGVPGAFMSVISSRFLTQAVRDEELDDTSEILGFLNFEIKALLSNHSETDNTQNALDISLVAIDSSKKHLEFSGLGQKALLCKREEIIELKGDNYHVGQNLDTEKVKISTKEMEFESKDRLYLFSDGLQDQFGGPESRKFGSKGLKNLVYSLSHQNWSTQKNLVEKAFIDWKNGFDQVDDTLFVGIEL
jgi:serine phosphatase RsbU (regulator of sigma subunit)